MAFELSHRCSEDGFASRSVGSVVLPSVLRSRSFSQGEASPSPVYGARLLSGLRAQPSRGFKSRRLRHYDGQPLRRLQELAARTSLIKLAAVRGRRRRRIWRLPVSARAPAPRDDLRVAGPALFGTSWVRLAAWCRRLFSLHRGPHAVPEDSARRAQDYSSGRDDRTAATTSRIPWLAAALCVLSRTREACVASATTRC